jgi:hypothetical protein
MAIEKPKYKVLKKEGNYEQREYDPYITSKVKVFARDYNEAASRGFIPLANYIFGANVSGEKTSMTSKVSAKPLSEKIAMTAPVTVTGSETYSVEFMIPRKYTVDSLPVPNDERVGFEEHPKNRKAVVQFSGRFNQENFEKHINLLQNWIRELGLNEKSDPIIAGYNPPFFPWFLKHNEVLIEV